MGRLEDGHGFQIAFASEYHNDLWSPVDPSRLLSAGPQMCTDTGQDPIHYVVAELSVSASRRELSTNLL